ncbi:2-oxoglutarate-dependent dioxygenase DAO-like [Rutidosis leptorrhynchoides]|uniref:2-oxoglutarate-dependent dioxygenase DAO-like n=1 Tax=Rutidosis leptorrhynchoides TaxID=125765 RepID=UPI003A9A3936
MMATKAVPVIDMQKVEGLGEELAKASEEWGCFRIINHGLSIELMAEMKVVAASIFELPEEIKRQTLDVGYGQGYVGRNFISPFYEGFSIDEISSVQRFCDQRNDSSYQREIIYKYTKAIRDLAGLLGRKLMEGSGLAGDLFDGWGCQLRMNKYHYCPESVGLTGAGLHSDPSFLTILQDDENVNGLQIVDKVSGEFVPVDPVLGTLVVNIGDMGKVWSNGRYYNVKHRIWCFEPKTRYSIALFVLGPNGNKVVAPPLFIDSEHPRLYVPIDAREYRNVRISKNLRNGETLELYNTTSASKMSLN